MRIGNEVTWKLELRDVDLGTAFLQIIAVEDMENALDFDDSLNLHVKCSLPESIQDFLQEIAGTVDELADEIEAGFIMGVVILCLAFCVAVVRWCLWAFHADQDWTRRLFLADVAVLRERHICGVV